MTRLSRRNFIKVSTITGTGLMLGFNLSGCSDDSGNSDKSSTTSFNPNAWLRITEDNNITIIVAESEMGQGVMTSLPMLIAEELEVDLNKVTTERAPVDPKFGKQKTGGSTSIREAWHPLRQAGAIARDMLITAAATTWKIAVSDCSANNGHIEHTISGKRLSYGELAPLAATLPIPETAFLKNPEEFRLIGKSVPLLNGPDMVTGKTLFGSDVTLPDLLVATIAHCPVFGGQLTSMDDSETRKIPGVQDVVRIDSGVAVVASHYWAAHKGLQSLKLEWDTKGNERISDQSIMDRFSSHPDTANEILSQTGDPGAGLQQAKEILEAFYTTPFQAHATMEPMNCTAHVHNGECDIWAPTQSPDDAQYVASTYILSTTEKLFAKIRRKISDVRLDAIRVHTTQMGGGFGRRLETDYVAEAVQLSLATGKPVKLIWSREQDMQHDFYRPLTHHRLSGGLDTNSRISAWKHHVIGPSRGKSTGGAEPIIYAVPAFQLGYTEDNYPVPTGYWRSVGSSHNGFVIESFVDELASSAGADPYQFRAGLLEHSPRNLAVLRLAAEKSGWGSPLAENTGRGIAVFESYGSHVAQVAEVTVTQSGTVRVNRVVCAVDCGIAVNPDTIKAQMEGAVVFGLTACLKSAINIEKGRVMQSNFHDFRLLRIDEMPVVETHIVVSDEEPGGIGEPGVPPIAAAITNAIYAATGVRIRRLPVSPADLARH